MFPRIRLINREPLPLTNSLKATVENPRGSVEKLSPKESAEDTDTVRVPKGFSEGKPEAVKPSLQA